MTLPPLLCVWLWFFFFHAIHSEQFDAENWQPNLFKYGILCSAIHTETQTPTRVLKAYRIIAAVDRSLPIDSNVNCGQLCDHQLLFVYIRFLCGILSVRDHCQRANKRQIKHLPAKLPLHILHNVYKPKRCGISVANFSPCTCTTIWIANRDTS